MHKQLTATLYQSSNDLYVAVSVAIPHSRFVAFILVNTLQEYAFAELRRCRDNPDLTRLKLYLPTSAREPKNPAHGEYLRNVLLWAVIRMNVPGHRIYIIRNRNSRANKLLQN